MTEAASISFLSSLAIVSLLVLSGCAEGCNNTGSEISEVKEATTPIELLNQGIIDNPNDALRYFDRAQYFKGSLDFESALNDIDRALSIDSLSSKFHSEKGAILYSMGNVGQAKFSLDRAIDIDPENLAAKMTLAEILFVLTNHEGSMKVINDALRIDPQISKAYFLKGLIYREQDNAKLSKSSFQTVTELDPDNAEAFNLLGMIYGAEGDSVAIQYYSTALSIDSTNKEVLYNRAYFYQAELQPAKAIWAYDELLRHHPGTAVAYYNKGYVLLGLLSQPEAAIDAFTEAVRFDPNYYQAYSNRGVAHEEIGRLDQAVADYSKALELRPNFEPAIAGLNRIH